MIPSGKTHNDDHGRGRVRRVVGSAIGKEGKALV